ncbi:restriction endonuclease subunit S [Streptomyces phaeochromogenes]|uniref:restriction endonuclease subunit S n=1 Tax=Streptomyces phaeochromogenes TaxID=1923 RepID=UPI0036769136
MASEMALAAEEVHIPRSVGVLPHDWRWSSLGSVCKGVFDCPHSTPKLTETGPFVVRTQDITSGILRLDSTARVSSATYAERIKRAEPIHGDLLYSREGTYFGIAAEVPRNVQVCLGQRMVLIRPDSQAVHYRFLRYWLNSPTMSAHIHGYRDGSVAERLNLTTIRALPILLPPIPQQLAIAGVLGALDEKIALNEQITATSDSLIRDLFDSSLRQPEAESAPLFEVFDITFGAPFKSAEFNAEGIGRPLLRIRDLKTFEPKVWTTQRHDKELVVATGDTVAGMDAEFRPTFWMGEPALLNQRVLHVRSRIGGGSPFCREVLRAPLALVENYKTGTTVAHLNKSDLVTLVVDIPSKDEVASFEAATAPLHKRLVAIAAENRTLAALRNTLLPQLMSGKLRVRDAEKIVEDAV